MKNGIFGVSLSICLILVGCSGMGSWQYAEENGETLGIYFRITDLPQVINLDTEEGWKDVWAEVNVDGSPYNHNDYVWTSISLRVKIEVEDIDVIAINNSNASSIWWLEESGDNWVARSGAILPNTSNKFSAWIRTTKERNITGRIRITSVVDYSYLDSRLQKVKSGFLMSIQSCEVKD
jgi:hypothetical protein